MQSWINVEELPEAVLVVDAQGQLAQLNARAEALFGYDRVELLGRSVELLLPAGIASPGPTAEPVSATARHKSGRQFAVQAAIGPGVDGSLVVLVRDASAERQRERLREEYLACLSHDLKGPLSVIGLRTALLKERLEDRHLPAEQREVELIARSNDFLRRLVDDLAEASHLESRRLAMHQEPVQLAAFVRDVVDEAVASPERARVSLEVAFHPIVSIDRSRIERVLVNLLQNALKYSPAGSAIVVRVGIHEGMAFVSVVDQGPGLQPEETTYVFDKYRRAPAARAHGGLGLGLYIARMIVEAHQGKIGVISTPGKGATFYLQLPLPKSERRKEAPPLARRPPRGLDAVVASSVSARRETA